MTTSDLSQPSRRLPLAILLLSLSTFTIGTSEFVILGLLPDLAGDLAVSLPAAGWLVTGYALGIAIGGPLTALVTARVPRKRSLVGLMAIFVVGNLLCALAPAYGALMAARVVTAVGQGAFFGIGAVLAAGLVPEHRRAGAIATMFAGLTLANVVGVPLGTALGHWAGWQAPFWLIALVGCATLIGLVLVLPNRHDEEHVDVRGELRALRDGRIWAALVTTVLFTTAIFPLFTYVTPLLGEVSQLSPGGIMLSLLCIGLGLTVGNYVGGRLADWDLTRALLGIAGAIAVTSLALRWTSPSPLLAELNWFLWGVVTFAAIPTLQVNVMRFGQRAPNLVSSLNIAAFNVGIALGAHIGGGVLAEGYTLVEIPVAAALLALVAMAAVHLAETVGAEPPEEEAVS